MIVKQAENEEKKKAKMGLNKDKKKEKKIPKWKMQSEQLRNQLKLVAHENNNQVGGNGRNIVMMDQPKYDSTQYDGYTHCDMCNRRYNEDAYKRHLNMCQKKIEKESLLKNNSANKPSNNFTKLNTHGTTGISQKPNLNVKLRKYS